MKLLHFIEESNRIEGITRPVTSAEAEEFDRFMALPRVSMTDLGQFVSVYQPGGALRSKKGMDVLVGNYVAPPGGMDVLVELTRILDHLNNHRKTPYEIHVMYERLHPFTDGNGRSGRMIWAWQMGLSGLKLGFLHRFYYQTLEAG